MIISRKLSGNNIQSIPLRDVVDAILYIASAGCAWRMLPNDFPPVSIVRYYFYGWRDDGIFEMISHLLVAMARELHGKKPSPTAGVVDSQSIKTTESGGISGYDAGKKIKGLKRHIVTDTLGFMVGLVVHSAGLQDRDGAPEVLKSIRGAYPDLRHIFADGGYAGPKLRDALEGAGNWTIQIVKRSDRKDLLLLVHYISGSRADFGLMAHCLTRLHSAPDHQVGIVVTGQHMVEKYGNTVDYIQATGLPVVAEIPVRLSGHSGIEMGWAMADELRGFLAFWQKTPPDLVLLLGDRGEMVAGALAAVHLGIHVAHLHGGERTGTLDESFRHAITKLSHIHFPATEDAATRIRRMGELPETVHVIGAPGLVGVPGRVGANSEALRARLGLNSSVRLALCVFHPVVQEAAQAAEQMRVLVEATRAAGYAMAVLRPNSDAGGDLIDAFLDTVPKGSNFRVLTHLERDTYLDLLGVSDLIIGNSSSGIIESASFAVPCVNIGARQNDRQRNVNTFDCPEVTRDGIARAIRAARSWPRSHTNVYGDGKTDIRLLECLNTLDIAPALLSKRLSF